MRTTTQKNERITDSIQNCAGVRAGYTGVKGPDTLKKILAPPALNGAPQKRAENSLAPPRAVPKKPVQDEPLADRAPPGKPPTPQTSTGSDSRARWGSAHRQPASGSAKNPFAFSSKTTNSEAAGLGGGAHTSKHHAEDDNLMDEDGPQPTPTYGAERSSVFARQDPQWEYFEIGPPRRTAEEPAARASNAHVIGPWPAYDERARANAATEPPDGAEKRKLCTKTSAGILLCRVHPHTNRAEAILVHKRYTYAFSEFVYGRYSRQNQKGLMALFEQMTTEELLDIWSLNFEQMWYRIWLAGPRRELFTKKHTKFYTSFIRDDGGKTLQQMLRQVQDRGVPFWEIPKGRPNGREGDLVCAMREFTEETGIEKKDYRLLPGVRRRVSFVHMGVRYVHVYYVAVAGARLYSETRTGWRRPVVPGRSVLSTADFMGEVDEVRWMDIEHVRFVDDSCGHLEAIIAPAFRLVKRFIRGRWDQRRARPANISGLDPGVLGALAALAASTPAEPGTDGAENATSVVSTASTGHAADCTVGRPQRGTKPDRPAKNPGNEIFRALLGLEYGQGARRAARRAARRQRASAEKKPKGHARPNSWEQSSVALAADGSTQDEKYVHADNKAFSKGGRAFGRGVTLAVSSCDERAPSRSQSPAPGSAPRPSTPDQTARRAAISRSRTPSAEALLKNPLAVALTEIDPLQAENDDTSEKTEAPSFSMAANKSGEVGAGLSEKAQNANQNKKVPPPSDAKPMGNPGSYMGALGLGPDTYTNAVQISSATDDEALIAVRRTGGVVTPALSKCESHESSYGLSRPREPAARKPQKMVGSPERRKAASSADEGWSFVQRRNNKKRQAADEKNAKLPEKTAPRHAPRRGKKDR